MKIALTGSSGFMAGSVLSLLEGDPEVEKMIGIDLRAPGELFQKLNWVKRDIRDPLIWQDMQGCEVLIHMAFIVLPIHNTAEAIEINVLGSQNVFNAAVKAGVRKIIYTSSISVYGAWPDHPMGIKEKQPCRGMPNFYYSWSKAKVEEYLDEFEKEHPTIVVTRLRPPVTLSSRNYSLTKYIIEQPFGIKLWNRDTKVQFVWDEDVAQARLLAIKNDFHGCFNLSADGFLTGKEMIAMWGKSSVTVPVQVFYGFVWLAWRLRLKTKFSPEWIKILEYPIITDNSKAKSVMGWTPKYNTSQVLALVLAAINDSKNK